MARPLYASALREAGCPDWVDLRAKVAPLPSVRAEDRVDATHGLYCPRCRPVVDRIRAQRNAAIEEAFAQLERNAPPREPARPIVDVPVTGGVL